MKNVSILAVGMAMVWGGWTLAGVARADEPPAGAPAGQGNERSEAELLAQFQKKCQAIVGPKSGVTLGGIATIDVPEGYWYVPRAGMAVFDKELENLGDPNTQGVLVKGAMDLALYFGFEKIGYVKDEESDLDADALMKALNENNEAGNVQRQQQGMNQTKLVGWVKKPFYNKETKSLEWGIHFNMIGVAGSDTANYETKRLGREGVMGVTLATSVDKVDAGIADMNKLMQSFKFVPGKDYASFQEGDKVAEIALGGLVAGGALVALAKMGFLQKFWKFLLIGGAAVVGGVAKLFGRKKKVAADVTSDEG